MTEPLDINDIPSLMERVSRLMAGTRWQTRLRNHFRELFTPAAKRNRMTDLQYIAKAEPQRLAILSLFAFDNFMTLRYGKNGELNFVETFMRNISGVSSDFYLSKQLELYEVVRTSRLTVYEVVQVTRDETFVVRDLIYGGDDIAIEYSPTLHTDARNLGTVSPAGLWNLMEHHFYVQVFFGLIKKSPEIF